MTAVVMTADEVAGELRSGMTIGIGGWGSRRKPMALVRAILRSGLADLTVVSYGGPDVGLQVAAGRENYIAKQLPMIWMPQLDRADLRGQQQAPGHLPAGSGWQRLPGELVLREVTHSAAARRPGRPGTLRSAERQGYTR
jgi:Coenzyme A transferase